jgi:hypothetical protein
LGIEAGDLFFDLPLPDWSVRVRFFGRHSKIVFSATAKMEEVAGCSHAVSLEPYATPAREPISPIVVFHVVDTAGRQIVMSFFPALWAVSFIVPVFTGKTDVSLTSGWLWLPATGVLAGWHLGRTVDDLYHYAERKKYYEERIRRLEPASAAASAEEKTDPELGG